MSRDKLIEAAEAGWNACRRQVYLLSEDYIERTHALKGGDTVEGNFYRGQYDVAKSFAKAFSAFEAIDCDYFKQIDLSALTNTGLPYGYVFQHEETGLQQVVDVQQVEWGFEKNNPRWQKIFPVYARPQSAAVWDGWMPIETAPENTAILVHIQKLDYYGNNGCYAAMLVNMGTGRRWMTFGHAIGRDLGPDDYPTHWMPLPAAPALHSTQEG